MIPKIINGNRIFDNRGSVQFNNDLKFNKIKRFYLVHNYSKNFVRAWHGHKVEAKFIFCIRGMAKISAVKIVNFNKPSKKSKVFSWKLNSEVPNVIYIPPGYANGSKSLTKDMKLIVLSTTTLKKSLNDDFRFPKEFWRI